MYTIYLEHFIKIVQIDFPGGPGIKDTTPTRYSLTWIAFINNIVHRVMHATQFLLVRQGMLIIEIMQVMQVRQGMQVMHNIYVA